MPMRDRQSGNRKPGAQYVGHPSVPLRATVPGMSAKEAPR